ncbi:hypothetical protein [Legionella waltersii]|nr:hypothetical protein [Legionella waltersii]SNV11182.1 Uncharacterised protein [Legionella waltersii]
MFNKKEESPSVIFSSLIDFQKAGEILSSNRLLWAEKWGRFPMGSPAN